MASILLVDDNEINLMMTEMVLSEMHYEVTTATNGADAIELLLKEPYDLLLLDIVMDGMSGIETLARIREMPEIKGIRTIILTSSSHMADMTEAIRLIRELKAEFDIPMINVTMGNPYKNPHVNRPYDNGNYVPDEHPLEGIGRMMQGVSEIQHAVDVPVISSAYSYLRQFAPNLAAAMVAGGHSAMCGFGRMAFAYPDFVQEARANGCIDKGKVCLSCGGC